VRSAVSLSKAVSTSFSTHLLLTECSERMSNSLQKQLEHSLQRLLFQVLTSFNTARVRLARQVYLKTVKVA
jgi:hypothetical protein